MGTNELEQVGIARAVVLLRLYGVSSLRSEWNFFLGEAGDASAYITPSYFQEFLGEITTKFPSNHAALHSYMYRLSSIFRLPLIDSSKCF